LELVKWRESYETGVQSMDRQHRKLIELINELYRVLRKEKTGVEIEQVLTGLTAYAEKHLKNEEEILKVNGYSDFAAHMEIHRGYRDKVAELIAESTKDNDVAVKDTYIFLRRWWMEHIVAEDRKYGEFLKSKGVE
jgi:hemerythrin-like metal-binding protein